MTRILTYSLLSFLLSLLVTPFVRNLFQRRGILDRPDAKRKTHSSAVPRVGGIAILLAYATAMSLAALLPDSLGYQINTKSLSLLKLLLATGLIFTTGLLDDLLGLTAWQKLAEQVTGALLAYLGGIQLHLFPAESWDLWLSAPLTVIWLVGCTNAFNLIDGMDGLAAGVGLFSTVTMFLAALISQNTDLAMVMAPLAGALLGFLRYNFNPASVFLGDCGSLTIGFLIGCSGVLWSQKSATLVSLTAPLMAIAIPLLDVGLTIIRRFLRHQPLFGADRGHIHHRLLDRGLKPRNAALVIYAVCGLFAALSLLQSVLHQQVGGLILLLFAASVWIGIQNLGYTEFAAARQMFLKGSFRRMIDSSTRVQQLERALLAAARPADCRKVIVSSSREFGFHGVQLNYAGELFEELPDDVRQGGFWQVRIPLRDGEYVNLWRKFQDDWMANPSVVGGFAYIVRKTLMRKEEEWREAGRPAILALGPQAQPLPQNYTD